MQKRYLIAGLFACSCWAEDHVVNQKDRAFSMPTIAVKSGDTITFVNHDEVVHNVFSISPGLAFDIKRQEPGGQSKSYVRKTGISGSALLHPSEDEADGHR